MKKKYLSLLSGIMFTLSLTAQIPDGNLNTGIIPKPVDMTVGTGCFSLNRSTPVYVDGKFGGSVGYIESELKKYTDMDFKVVSDSAPGANSLRIVYDAGLSDEAYRLNIDSSGILISASGNGGMVNGFQSLLQLIRINNNRYGNMNVYVPSLSINDSPIFGWRGFMVDVVRHFFTVGQLKEVIDQMSSLKLNRLHLHLSDDQGIRVEFDKYPKLNSVGSWRVDYNCTDENVNAYWGRPVQKPGENSNYGGFYTKDEIRELVDYARIRNIEILPEIDVPGHSQAFIASYPELACKNKPYYIATGAVRHNNTLCPSNEKTYRMIDAIISELVELFPFEYIHIGGDECSKLNWQSHAQCQEFKKKNGLKDEHELQSYFIKRVENIVNSYGRKMIGWDEILEGGLAPNATVMSWRGEKGGIASARMHHDVIMSPSTYTYLDFKQGQSDFEPNIGYAETLLSKTYAYSVIPDVLTDDEACHIKGVQANMWSESLSDFGKLTYMAYPRLWAVSENGWTPKRLHDWDDFVDRVRIKSRYMEEDGVRISRSVFNPWVHHDGNGRVIKVWLTSELSSPEIRYTLDGTDPTWRSPLYSDTLIIEKTCMLKAAIFDGRTRLGNLLGKHFIVHKAAGADVRFMEKGNGATGFHAASLQTSRMASFFREGTKVGWKLREIWRLNFVFHLLYQSGLSR